MSDLTVTARFRGCEHPRDAACAGFRNVGHACFTLLAFLSHHRHALHQTAQDGEWISWAVTGVNHHAGAPGSLTISPKDKGLAGYAPNFGSSSHDSSNSLDGSSCHSVRTFTLR
jgi:hypothetical protein